MKAILLLNPQAGAAEQFSEFLESVPAEDTCEVRAARHTDDARWIAREAVREGFDRIILAGGDGTISAVINAIAPEFAIELAVLPMGTGNDLARTLGLFAGDYETIRRAAFGREVLPIDVIKITDLTTTYCVNVANGGLGGQVAIDVQAADKKRWGWMAYWMHSVSHLIDLQTFEVRITLDGEVREFETLGIAVANGRCVGGGFPIAPDAIINDGFLDVTMVPVLPMLELMAAGINFALGRQLMNDRIQTWRGRKVRIESTPDMPFSIDGEPTQRYDATFEIIPGALPVAVPVNPSGN